MHYTNMTLFCSFFIILLWLERYAPTVTKNICLREMISDRTIGRPHLAEQTNQSSTRQYKYCFYIKILSCSYHLNLAKYFID